MHSSNTLRFLFVLAVTAMGCSTQVVPPTGGGGRSSSSSTSESVSSSSGLLSPPGTYVLDFTGCLSGGLELGGNTGVSFTFDQQPVRTYAIQDLGPQIGPGLIGSDDGFRGCPLYPSNFEGGGKLTDHLAAVGQGDVANVSDVTLDILAEHKNVNDLSQTYCYIYRNEAGTWTADSSKASRTWDASANMFHVTLSINMGPINALYFTTTDGPSNLARLTYVVTQ